jgi:reverse gyrase
MSSDDTETERNFFAGKVVRRVRKLWISTEVTKVLFNFIAKHYLTSFVVDTPLH